MSGLVGAGFSEERFLQEEPWVFVPNHPRLRWENDSASFEQVHLFDCLCRRVG